MYGRGGRGYSGRPLPNYSERPHRRDYLYGRYYILKLNDGSYVAAFADQHYGVLSLTGTKVTFPIGRLVNTSNQEKEWLEEAALEYPVDTSQLLYMIHDESISDMNFWDLLVRFVAVALVIGIVIGITALIVIIHKRKKMIIYKLGANNQIIK